MKKLFKSKKGFTLVEMIVVIVIIAILTAALVVSLIGYVNKAKASTAQVEASNAYTAAQAYISETLGTKGEASLSKADLISSVDNLVGASVGAKIEKCTYDSKGTITLFQYHADNGVICVYSATEVKDNDGKVTTAKGWTTNAAGITGLVSGKELVTA